MIQFYASWITIWRSCLATWYFICGLSWEPLLVFPCDHLNLTQLYSSVYRICRQVFLHNRNSFSTDLTLITSYFNKERCRKKWLNSIFRFISRKERKWNSTTFIFMLNYYLLYDIRKGRNYSVAQIFRILK